MAPKKKGSHPRKGKGAGVTVATPAPIAAPAKPPRRHRFAIAAVAVVAIVAAAFAVYRWSDSLFRPWAPDAPTVAAARPAATYVGGDACASCHDKQLAAWKGSDHDLAMQIADDKSVLGNFDNAKITYAGTTSTLSRRDGKFFVNTDGPDGKLADYEIKYTFGVHPLQQYLIEFPGGRKQALGIAWDSRPKTQGGQRWFHLYPGQNIKAGDPLHWTGVQQNWNFQCAECHSTDLRKNFDAEAGTFDTRWAQINVSCEACHGPGSNHLAWANKSEDWHAFDADKGLVLALDERKGVTWMPLADTGNAKRSTPRATTREIDTCARCHSRSARLTDDYVHGKPLLDSHRPALLDEGLYWNDGQMRDEVYNWGSFAQSRMYASGVTCSDCHDPHSLKLTTAAGANTNGVCAQCHQPAKYDAVAHTHHATGTPGAACAACHMPTTTYMQVDPRHDHSMRIPRPDVSAKLGMPNACNNCHTKQTPQWSADAIATWTGKPPASFQNFAAALNDGTRATPAARGELLALIQDKAQPVIVRASAIQRLGPLITPGTLPTLAQALNDPDPVVRLAAVEALSGTAAEMRQRYVPRMLDDPVLAVRIEAARILGAAGGRALPAAQRPAFDKALAQYMQVQTYNADRPEGQTSLGNVYAQGDNPEAAIAAFRKAIELDPTFVPAYTNLADLYRARGADGEAVATLRAGIARNPRAGTLYHVLGLALIRQKQTADGVKALATAAQLTPANARLAYVYAVALNDSGRVGEAMQVLHAALKRDPYDRDLLSGLAFFSARSGDRESARRYVAQLRELDPENTEYERMAKSVEGAPSPTAR